jgi:erythromycin esterase-like protein
MNQPFSQRTREDWVAHAAIPFSVNSRDMLHSAIDTMIATIGSSVELLAFGEALHGSEELLLLRNRLFQHLVEAHGYSAIAIESSFPRAQIVNEYIAGRGPTSYEALQEAGFSHGFGRLTANRELVEWMRHYNANPANPRTIRFYGFDSPTEMIGTDSPRQVLSAALDYLTALDPTSGQQRRERIESLLGSDADWENPAASMDPTQAVGLSPAASALRTETEDLITELHIRRPELVAKSSADRYAEALQYASLARQLLTYHAELARTSYQRIAILLGMRDSMMADTLAFIVAQERGRGKVLAFAHNRHVQRGMAQWQLGAQLIAWWPAGAHLNQLFGTSYVNIGSAIGVSAANGIGQPEPGTLEAVLTSRPEPAYFIPTHNGHGLDIATLPIRSGSTLNPTYMPLTQESFTDFDWLTVLQETAYNRGGPL